MARMQSASCYKSRREVAFCAHAHGASRLALVSRAQQQHEHGELPERKDLPVVIVIKVCAAFLLAFLSLGRHRRFVVLAGERVSKEKGTPAGSPPLTHPQARSRTQLYAAAHRFAAVASLRARSQDDVQRREHQHDAAATDAAAERHHSF